jgi:type II secretory pathway component PulF
VQRRISSGDALAASFKGSNGYFPPMFCEMVEVGERTGRMERVFFRLAEHYEQIVRLRNVFLMALAWPMFELTMGILAVAALIYVLGLIGANWDGEPITVFGLYGGRGAAIWLGAIACIAALIAAPWIAIQKGWLNPDPLYRILIHVPGIGKGLRTFSLSRLTWSLAMATDTDLSAEKAVELAVRSTQNGYYTDRLEQILLALRRRGEMHQAFRSTGIYPADFLDALETGELSGRISESMAVVAKDYEERTRIWSRAMAAACGVAIFLMVAGLMIYMIFYLFTNLYLRPIQDTLNSM